MKSIFKVLFIFIGVFATFMAWSQNSWNSAAIYNGSCYYASLQNVLNTTSGELTVEFWAKINSPSGYDNAIIGKNQFRIMTSNRLIRVQVNGTTLLNSVGKLDSGIWNHVTVSFSNTNNAKKFI